MRSRFLVWLLAVLWLAPVVAAAERPPNIVFILADDMGYGDMGTQGAQGFATPNLDRLAREGTRFTNFLAAQPVCTASRAALLSGCYPNRIGMAGALNHTSRTGIHPDEVLLPELLRTRGYATACFGKWHLGTLPDFFPTRNGFDMWSGLPYSNDNGPRHPTIQGLPALPLYDGDEVIERDPDQAQFTNRFTARAIRFIEENSRAERDSLPQAARRAGAEAPGKSRPFFLYLPHVMPHVPIFASEKFRGRTAKGLYGDAMAELDAGVGDVLAALEKNGLAENTLVIFASDNGPFLSYGDHAGSSGVLRGGKLTCFEGGVRVPCLMRWPGKIPAGRVCDALVTGLDLLPTLAHLTGATLPDRKIDGVDVWPVISGATPDSPRKTFLYFNGDELHAVREGDWKLHLPHEYLVVAGEPGRAGKPSNWGKMQPRSIEESGIRGIASRHGYRVERMDAALYDLRVDVGETHDVSARHPDIVARLQKLAEAARTDLGDSLVGTKGSGLRECGRK